MQQAQQRIEEPFGFVDRPRVDRHPVSRLYHFEIPPAEIVPEEFVEQHEGLRNAVAAEIPVQLRHGAAQRLAEPFARQAVVVALGERPVHRPAVDEPVGVPNLVAEIAALLAQRLVEHHVVAGRRRKQHRHAHTVGAVLRDQVERIGRVAQLLGHLASDLVAHDAGEIDVAEGLLAAIFVTGHDHARHPEEDDVGARHQIGRRVVVANLLVVGVADAVEDRNRPQPRREPRVQHVVVLSEVGRLQRGVAGFRTRLFERLPGRRGHHEAALGQVPGRNALAPPQLARDAPVLDVLHPVAVGVLVFFGHEADRVLHDGLRRRFGQLPHREEPLHREFRLDGHARALRIAHVVGIILGLLQQAGFRQVAFDLSADVETIHADVQPHFVVDRAVVVEDVDHLEVVFLAQHVIVHVVRRGHFQRARTELDIDVFVADYGDCAVHQRYDDARPGRQPAVARVVGVDAQRRVAQDRFGARRGDDDRLVRAFDHVAQVVELAVRLLEYHLFVRQRRLRRGIPVDHAYAAVDLAFLVKVAEYLDDALGAGFVHREAGALPVARGAQLAQLPEDHAAVFFLPLPGVFEEFLARERRLLDALFMQHRHDFRLRGDRRVIHARHPAGVFARHAGTADQHVLQRVVEHVPHVEHTGHVGRRDDDRIGFASVGFRMEQPVVDPVVVPFLFDLLRRIFISDLHKGKV